MSKPRPRGVLFTAALVLSLLASAPGAIFAGSTSGNVNVRPGIKALDEEDWSPIEDQPALGVNVSWGKTTGPIQLVVD